MNMLLYPFDSGFNVTIITDYNVFNLTFNENSGNNYITAVYKDYIGCKNSKDHKIAIRGNYTAVVCKDNNSSYVKLYSKKVNTYTQTVTEDKNTYNIEHISMIEAISLDNEIQFITLKPTPNEMNAS